MNDLEYEIRDRFDVTLENLTDEYGTSCTFPIELSVTSPGHGDSVAQRLEYRMRLACYEAAAEFDAELADPEDEA
jgi:hypothetical protein